MKKNFIFFFTFYFFSLFSQAQNNNLSDSLKIIDTNIFYNSVFNNLEYDGAESKSIYEVFHFYNDFGIKFNFNDENSKFDSKLFLRYNFGDNEKNINFFVDLNYLWKKNKNYLEIGKIRDNIDFSTLTRYSFDNFYGFIYNYNCKDKLNLNFKLIKTKIVKDLQKEEFCAFLFQEIYNKNISLGLFETFYHSGGFDTKNIEYQRPIGKNMSINSFGLFNSYYINKFNISFEYTISKKNSLENIIDDSLIDGKIKNCFSFSFKYNSDSFNTRFKTEYFDKGFFAPYGAIEFRDYQEKISNKNFLLGLSINKKYEISKNSEIIFDNEISIICSNKELLYTILYSRINLLFNIKIKK